MTSSSFISYYWKFAQLDAQIRVHVATLRSDDATPSESLEAWLRLLLSSDRAAVGVGLDWYSYLDAQRRFGRANPLAIGATQALAVARQELEATPVRSVTENGVVVDGANFASALGLLAVLGEPEDISQIHGVLSASEDNNVLLEGCLATGHVFLSLDAPPPGLVDRLAAIARGPSYWPEVRGAAVSALGAMDTTEAEEALIELVQSGIPLAAEAAVEILYRKAPNERREFVEDMIATTSDQTVRDRLIVLLSST